MDNERLVRVEERLEHAITKIDDIKNNHLKHIYGKLEILANRPSWLVTSILAFLSSVCVALITRELMVK